LRQKIVTSLSENKTNLHAMPMNTSGDAVAVVVALVVTLDVVLVPVLLLPCSNYLSYLQSNINNIHG